ncbi:MAG: 50S ribosomal protein L10, partial [bacterium]|nr:50S ribosomal protein L10 [bacterium]
YDETVGLATFAFLTDYQQIPVVEMERLRVELAGLDAGIVIMKNTLARIVFERHGLEEVSEYLAGPSMLIHGTGEVAPVAKQVDRFMRIHKEMTVKAIIFDGAISKGSQFKSFTTLPTKDEVRAKLLGVLQAPLGNFLRVNNVAQRLVTVFSQYADKAEAT